MCDGGGMWWVNSRAWVRISSLPGSRSRSFSEDDIELMSLPWLKELGVLVSYLGVLGSNWEYCGGVSLSGLLLL